MSSLQRISVQASTQKQPQEEETDTISLLSNYNSCEFNNIILAHKDPYY